MDTMIKRLLLILLALPLTLQAQISADDYSGCAGTVPNQPKQADPANYISMINSLQPGDILQLASGDQLCFYDGNSTTAPLIGCSTMNMPFYVIQATAANTTGCITTNLKI